MLSRTAESFFWIGRYLERAEYTARFTNVNYHLLLEIAAIEDQAQTWEEYLEANGELGLYRQLYGETSTRSILEYLTINRDNPNSLIGLIHQARNNARGIQDQLSTEVWYHLNEFHLFLQNELSPNLWVSPHRFMLYVQNMCYTADGVFGSTMLHGDGWNFYRLGKNIERAGRTARLLDDTVLKAAAPEPGAISEYHQCLAILKAASAYEAYRKFYRSELVPRKIVQFLLFHNKFPRSVRFSATLIRKLLLRVSEGAKNQETRETERLAGQLAADLEFGTLEEVYRLGLSEFLTQVIDQLDQITNRMAATFFRSAGYSDVPTVITTEKRRPAIHSTEPTQTLVKAVLAVRHQFHYSYEAPVSKVSTLMRLAPPQHYGRQRRLDLRWHLDPPADTRHFTDAFGNMVWQLDHEHIEKEIVCTVEMRIENQAWYLHDQSLSLQGIQPQESDCTVEMAEFLRLTKLVNSSDRLTEIAHKTKSRGMTPVEIADSLLYQVHAHMRYEPGRTHVGTTASQAFAQAAGVCQDYAHIMLSLCRQVGLPSRYVSGYLPGEGQMHAWIEVFMPVGHQRVSQWVAYDPTHQRRCDERYITVAVGRDYQDIAPTSGYYSGPARNYLTVAVSVVMESQGSGERWVKPQLMPQETAANQMEDIQQQQ